MNWPEVKAWRKAMRARLIAARVATPASLRAQWTEEIAARLQVLLAGAVPPISFYWPFKAEPDLRPLMRALDAAGIAVALPVAIRLGEPMTFRPWTRGAKMEPGIWNIPIPATESTVVPKTVIAPTVGYDDRNYRLGYGGGFFDRTLLKLGPDTVAIGVGFSMFRLPTIWQQPHDLVMGQIVTERRPVETRLRPSPRKIEEADYTRPLSNADLAKEICSLSAVLPRERQPLLDLVLWQLTGGAQQQEAEVAQHGDPAEYLSRFLPRIRDETIHTAVRVLRDSLGG